VLWLHLIFVNIIPFGLLLWLNKKIHQKLSEHLLDIRRTGHDTLRRRELRLARVSMLIVLIYMICHTPKLIPTMCELIYGNAKVIPFFIEISHLLLCINCSLNFPVYFIGYGASFTGLTSRISKWNWRRSSSRTSNSRWNTMMTDISSSSSLCPSGAIMMSKQAAQSRGRQRHHSVPCNLGHVPDALQVQPGRDLRQKSGHDPVFRIQLSEDSINDAI